MRRFWMILICWVGVYLLGPFSPFSRHLTGGSLRLGGEGEKFNASHSPGSIALRGPGSATDINLYGDIFSHRDEKSGTDLSISSTAGLRWVGGRSRIQASFIGDTPYFSVSIRTDVGENWRVSLRHDAVMGAPRLSVSGEDGRGRPYLNVLQFGVDPAIGVGEYESDLEWYTLK